MDADCEKSAFLRILDDEAKFNLAQRHLDRGAFSKAYSLIKSLLTEDEKFKQARVFTTESGRFMMLKGSFWRSLSKYQATKDLS